MIFSTRSLVLIGLASGLLPQALAQTYTSCNPLNQTDCPIDPALGTNVTFQFNSSAPASSLWNATAGTVDYTSSGGEFTVAEQGDSPTIESNFYMFFGRVSVVAKSAPGQGIVSSIVLESDDLDEVDIEWIGGNNTHWQSNYFGKGNTTSYDRAYWHEVDTPQDTWHNYTVDWTKEKLEWWVDSTLIRTLNYEDANNGDNYPQTPMTLKLGIWAGGDSDSNDYWTVQWAGGEVDYDDGPFTMYVQSVYCEDYSSGKSYKYGDTSGSYESIEITNGTSAVEKYLTTPHTTAEKWAALPTWARILIPVGAVSVLALALGAMIFCCIKQRKAGRSANKVADDQWQKEQEELLEYKSQYKSRMQSGEYAPGGKL